MIRSSRMMTFIFLLSMIQPAVASLDSLSSEITSLVESVKPGVVKVTARTMGPLAPAQPPTISGTGFLLGEPGRVVTAYSIVSNASRISVTLQDLSEHPASLLSVDSTGVLATLLVESPFPANAAALQASPEPAGGMAVIAYWARNAGVTSQMVQLPPTATASGPFDIPFGLPVECNGAVLVDLAGKATAALVLSKGYREPPKPFPSSEGLFLFKVAPLALLEGTLSLVTSNEYQPWLGASVQPVDGVAARNLAIEAKGVYVAEVDKDSPAQKAGLRGGDIILEVEGQDIPGISDLKAWLIQVQPGGSLKLRVRDSGGAHKQCLVTRPSS